MGDIEELKLNSRSQNSSNSANANPILDKAISDLLADRPVEPSRLGGIRNQLQILLNQVGSVRFQQAIECTLHTHKGDFFPTIATIRSNVPSASKSPLCGKCQSGWVVAYHADDGLPYMRRCECRGGREADRRIDQGSWHA